MSVLVVATVDGSAVLDVSVLPDLSGLCEELLAKNQIILLLNKA